MEENKTKTIEPLDSLVRAAQEGDAEAFNRIVERFQDMACASAYALIEDVAQEAFLEAYLSVAKLREPAAFAGWFRHIILKKADRMTRGKRLMSSSLEAVTDVPMDTADPCEIAETNEVRAQVRRALFALPERERLVIVLFYGTGYALKDIAAFLDVPVTTVKKRLYDGRQRLKDELINVVRDALQEQRPSIPGTFPAKVRLLIAARLGDIDSVKELLARSLMLLNMQTEWRAESYHSVLSVAVGLTALCEYGANCNARTSAGLTPLHGAVLSGCHTTAAVLLKYGAHPELALTSGLTALHLAAMKGDSEMVRLLLSRGADIDSRSRHDRTPLHWAALKGYVEAVQLLFAHGADPDKCDSTDRTPRDWAIGLALAGARKHCSESGTPSGGRTRT